MAQVAVRVAVLMGAAASNLLFAQSQDASKDPRRFDVVAIKPDLSGAIWSNHSPIRDKVGRYTARNASLKSLIMWSYDVYDSQVIGGPRWLGADRFDVDAQVDGEPSHEQIGEMIRTMLADRFHLKVHLESREMPHYVLAAPKDGLRFGPHLAKADDRDCSAGPGAPGCRGITGGAQGVEIEHVTFAVLAVNLASMTGVPVADETGLAGRYDFKLDLLPSETGTQVSFGDAVMNALQDQVGVRVEWKKVPTKVVVVESAEKPGDN